MATVPYYNSFPAQKHTNLDPTTVADAAAARALGKVYKAIYFNTTGTVNVVDMAGNGETVTGAAGGVYPVQNFGVYTGGTLTDGQFLLLSD